MVRGRRPILLLVAAALLVPAAPADAKTTAQRFADVFERAESAVRAKDSEFRAVFDQVEFERPTPSRPSARSAASSSTSRRS